MTWAWGLLVVCAATACAAEEVASSPCPPNAPEFVDPTGTAYQYVVDSLDLPSNASEAQWLGFDLDCDPQARPDNALGQITSFLSGLGGYDLDDESKQLIDDGKLLHLIQVRTTSFEDAAGVGVTILHAEDLDADPLDNFTGMEAFGIDESRGRGGASGRFEAGVLSAEYGTAPLAITFPGLDEPFILRLVAVRVELQQTESGIAGRIGGALPGDEIDTALIPVLTEGLSRIVARDCDASGCDVDSFGESLLEVLDENMDGALDEEELRTNDVVSSLLAPDVDLFDEHGRIHPRSDELKDSLSVALGFTAVGASFPEQ